MSVYILMFQFVKRIPNRVQLSAVSRKTFCTSSEPVKKKFGFSSLFKSATFQRAIRIGRVIFVSVAIYQTGFQNGMIHFAQDPQAVEQELIKFSLGIDEKDQIENHIHSKYSLVFKRVSRIGGRIVVSAREHSATMLAETQKLIDKTKADDPKLADLIEQKQMWRQACKRLNGDWNFVICKSPEVNAFVTGFCPRKVFVFEGLLNNLKLTDDELAIILGHELSHVVLGHIEEQTPRSAIVLGTQLVLMSMVDPIGLGSFLFDMVVSRFGDYIQASYSRQNEFDADELGLLLTSMACFDINAGASVHEKLGEHSHHHEASLSDTHPSSRERKHKLITLAESHEKQRLVDPIFQQFRRDCVSIQRAWHDAIFSAKKK